VRFHDNALLTAEDVKATFDRIIFPPAGVLSWAESLFEGVKEVKIVDPLTVQFILSEPRAAIIELVSLEGMGISRKKTLDDNNGDLKRAFPIPGTGPYIVKSWEHGEFWKYEKNPNYWDPGLPYVDGITFRNFNWGPDTSAVFLGGRLDFAMGIDPNGFEIAQDRKEFAVGQFAAAEDQGLWFNFKRKPFDDVRVRKAFHLVVDYVGARTALEAVQPMIGRGWLMPGDPLEPDNWAKAKDQPGWRKRTSEDIAEAKKLMADAGFAGGIKKVQMRGRDEPHGRLVSQLVQGWIKQHLGVEADISLDTPGILYDELIRADFDITEMGPGFATPFFWEHWGTNFVTDGSTNWGSYSNPEFDKLFAEISGTTDQAKQAELVEQMTAILDKDQPILLWGSNLITVGWKTDVKGHNMPNRSIGEPSRWDIIWLDR
jgi:peptide/nickel transport system substrate-binding protein